MAIAAERLPVNIAPEELHQPPPLPFPRSEVSVGIDQASSGRQDEAPGQVGGGLVKDPRRIRQHDATLGRRLDVEVVEPDGHVGDDLQRRALLKNRLGDDVGQQREGALLPPQPLDELGRGERHVALVGFDVAVSRHVGDRLFEDLSGDQDLGSQRSVSFSSGLDPARDAPARKI